MKQFAFRLDPVIRFRKHLERMALMELAKTKQAFFQAKQDIERLVQQRRNAMANMNHEEEQGIDGCRIIIYKDYLRGLTDRISMGSDRLLELAALVREKERAVEAERIKKETLESLREKRYAAYLKQCERAEQKASDEVVSLRWPSGVL